MSKFQQYELNFDHQENLVTSFLKPPSPVSYLTAPRFCPKVTSLAILLTVSSISLFLYYSLAYISHEPRVEPAQIIKFMLEIAFLFLCTAAVWKHAILRD